MGVNAYFGTRRTNMPHETPKYVPGKSKFEIDYYKHNFSSIKPGSNTRNVGKIR